MSRAHNFSAGPAAIPLPALERAQAELLDFGGSGMSVMELSHRSKEFAGVHEEAKALVHELLGVSDDYAVLFLQGGASLQFAMLPMNFLAKGESADYVNTGSWSKKAISEAKRFGAVNVVATTADSNFNHVPAIADLKFDPNAKYAHVTSNNTIFGTQFHEFPDTGSVPLVSDMSSDIMSRPLDVNKFGMIYAGAQKNLGPSGVTLVIIRKDWAEKAASDLPTMLDYRTHIEGDSMYNTPPTFGIYMLRNVLAWVKDEGGVEAMAKLAQERAAKVYGVIDGSGGYYKGHAQGDSRSLMNITFNLAGEDLEKKFVAEAAKENLVQLKGHRSVGGIRTSIYNACTMDTIDTLVAFMKDFQAKNG